MSGDVPRYIVTGPERLYVDAILDGQGPATVDREVYLVDARTAGAARWAAYHYARAQRTLWAVDLGVEHPLAGVTVEPAGPEDTPEVWAGFYVAA